MGLCQLKIVGTLELITAAVSSVLYADVRKAHSHGETADAIVRSQATTDTVNSDYNCDITTI